MMLTPAFHFDVLVAFVLPFYNDERPPADRTDGGRLIFGMMQQVLRGGRFDRSERRLVFPGRAVLSGPMYGHDPRAKVRCFGQAEKIGAFRRVLCDFERGLPRPDRADIDRWSVIEAGREAPEFDDVRVRDVESRSFPEVLGRVRDVKQNMQMGVPRLRVAVESDLQRPEPSIERAGDASAPGEPRPSAEKIADRPAEIRGAAGAERQGQEQGAPADLRERRAETTGRASRDPPRADRTRAIATEERFDDSMHVPFRT